LKVTLTRFTPLPDLVLATRICHASGRQIVAKKGLFAKIKEMVNNWFSPQPANIVDNPTVEIVEQLDDVNQKDKALLARVILQSQHTSLLEFINYTFLIESVCGSTLLQLTRHRHGSYGWHDMGLAVQSSRHTLKRTGIEVTYSRNKWVNAVIWIQKMLVRFLIWLKIPNDDVKLALPQAYNYNLYMTINARSLGNLLSLRLARNAHYDIREMSQLILDSLPEEHRFLFTSCENQGETV
jgi:thymidylate synthase (FAD)